MNKVIKYLYYLLTIVFVILTFYEVFVYLRMDSNYFGVFYLFINFFIMFLLCSISYNYESGKFNIRISKNVLLIVLGIFASFLLSLVLSRVFSYVDESSEFISNIFVISKVIKPIIYFMIFCVSLYEIRVKKK